MRARAWRREIPLVLVTCLCVSLVPALRAEAAKKKPDLVVRAVAASPTAGFPGESISVETTTANAGKAKAGKSTTSFYLSTDERYGKGDRLLKGSLAIPALKPKKASSKTRTVSIPTGVKPGTYHLLACADATKKVKESKEGNNCRAGFSTIKVIAPTSDHLIEQAVAAGKLKPALALQYRLFALFDDDRLPPKFKGDDSGTRHSDALQEAAGAYEGLSPAVQAKITPFLIPPYHEGSHWADGSTTQNGTTTQSSRASRGRSAPAETPWCDKALIAHNWHSVDTLNGKVRVWWQQRYNATDNAEAHDIANAIDQKIWPALTGLMGREPLSDESFFGCDGGDGKLDIALVDAATATTFALGSGCKDAAARMLFNRGRPNRLPYVAHELMHAVQYSYPKKGGCKEYEWLREATAQWFMDYVSDPLYGFNVPPNNTEWEHGAPERFLDHPELPLESHSPNERGYGAYLFFYYLARQTHPMIVKQVWDLTASRNSVEAVKEAVGASFDVAWKEFVLFNWNRDTVDQYRKWDGLTAKAAMTNDATLPKGKTNHAVTLNHLSAKYVTYRPAKQLTTLDFTNKNPGATGQGIQAIITYKDGKEKIEDWSDKEEVEICLEDPEVEKITLVFSNSNSEPGKKLDLNFEWDGKAEICCTSDTATQNSSPRRSPARSSGSACPDVSGTIIYTRTESWSPSPGGECCTGSSTLNADIDVSLKSDPLGFLEDDGSSYTLSYQRQDSGRYFDCNFKDQASGSGSGLVALAAGKVVEEGQHSPITGSPAETRQLLVGIGKMVYDVSGTGSLSGCANPSHNGSTSYGPDQEEIWGKNDLAQACGEDFAAWFEFIAPAKGSSTLNLSCSTTTEWGETHTLKGTLTLSS